jgi:hypothetical protein
MAPLHVSQRYSFSPHVWVSARVRCGPGAEAVQVTRPDVSKPGIICTIHTPLWLIDPWCACYCACEDSDRQVLGECFQIMFEKYKTLIEMLASVSPQRACTGKSIP